MILISYIVQRGEIDMKKMLKSAVSFILTAVIITSAFEELSDVGWVMYVVGVAGAAILFLFSILVMKFINTKE